MSMLSAQCDELRERAATLRQGRWSDGADDARLMEDAADTIWELRDDLQRANAENAKLREELDAAKQDLQVFSANLARLGVENAKLREMAKDFLDVPCQCLRCEHYNYEEDRCDLRDRARELGYADHTIRARACRDRARFPYRRPRRGGAGDDGR